MADPTPKPLTPKPLPFDPTGLRGLSEKLLRSHYDNNYSGAVKKLAAVREELARLPDTAPGFVRSGLLHNEAMFRGSVVLHEAYFGHLGGDGKPGQTAADQSYVKAATLCHASRSSTLLHSSEASAEPSNILSILEALETSQAEMPGWLKAVSPFLPLNVVIMCVILLVSHTSSWLKA